MIIEETVTFKLSNSKFAILGIFCPIFSVPKIMFLAPENKKAKQVLKFSSEKNINENNHKKIFNEEVFFVLQHTGLSYCINSTLCSVQDHKVVH